MCMWYARLLKLLERNWSKSMWINSINQHRCLWLVSVYFGFAYDCWCSVPGRPKWIPLGVCWVFIYLFLFNCGVQSG